MRNSRKSSVIAVVLNQLTGGGAERNLVRVAEHLAREGAAVHLLVLRESVAEDIHPSANLRVERLCLQRDATVPRRLWETVKNLRAIRKHLTRINPDKILSFCCRTNLLALETSLGLGVPVIVSERNNLFIESQTWMDRLRRRIWYPRAENVVLLAEELSPWASRIWPRWHFCAIPNFVPPPPPSPVFVRANESELARRKSILGLGRFVEQKGFDLLIPIFSKLVCSFPDWDLILVGDGPDRPRLEALSKRLGLDGRIHFPGWSADPYPHYYATDIFAFPSRFEGFGMTLAEALSCGLPAVAFNCPFGPSRIVEHGVNGFLVPPGDDTDFENKLRQLMDDEKLRSSMGAAGKRILQTHGAEPILRKWSELVLGSK